MNVKGLYLYGFVNVTEALRIGPIGLDSREVYLKSGGSFSVAVSDVDGIDFSQLPKETLLKYVAEHQRTLERLMERGRVIPLKFGSLVQDSQEVDTILAKGQDRILETFEKVRGRTEMDLVAGFSDFEGVLKEISMSESILTFQRKARPESKAALHQARVTLGKMVKSALEEKRKGYVDAIMKSLSRVSVASRVLDIRDDATIANLACLLEEKDLARFETEIEVLDREFEDRVNFKLIGPLPCNSFHTLMIENVNFEEIDFARKCLDLPEKVTASDIKSAYRLMTKACHPDSGTPGTSDQNRFEAINKSYRLLMDVCRGGSISFPEDDENAWLDIRPVKSDHRGVP